MADEDNHINKRDFKVPYVCGCRDLGEALRRIAEGAAFMRTKGEAGPPPPDPTLDGAAMEGGRKALATRLHGGRACVILL